MFDLFNKYSIFHLFFISLIVSFITFQSIECVSSDFQNVTVSERETTHLKCPLNDMNNSSVTWIRMKDRHILTNGLIKYTSDPRFSPHFQNNYLILQIRNVSINDTGVYKCGNTNPLTGELIQNTTDYFMLNVLDPITKNNELINILNLLEIKSEDQNEKIKHILIKAEDIIKRAEDSKGDLNPAVIVNEFLPDPIPVKDFNISEDGGLTYFEANFKNLSIHGLKQMKISKLLFNLGLIQLKVVMEIPVISLQGIYELEGKVTFLSVYGDGDFYMNVTYIEINAYGSLDKTKDGKMQISDIELDVYTDNIDLHLNNLMGGGMMGGITNSLINQMSGMIFDHIKNTMIDEVSVDIKNMINTQLSHLPLDFLKKDSSSIFDNMLLRVSHGINESGLDPMSLPAFKDRFNYNILVFKLNGELKVFNGYLSGLSSLVRTGDIIASYNNNEVIFEARMGFTNLTGGYDWSTNVMGGGPSGSTSITLSEISCYLRLKQSLKKGQKPTISSFKIEKIKHLWIDVNGLGSWDFILEIIINLVSNAFKLSLANAISGPVTEAIQKELNHLPISFI